MKIFSLMIWTTPPNETTLTFYLIMKEVAATSDLNLVRYSNAFLTNGGKIYPDFTFSWVNYSYFEIQEKFQLGY